MFCWPRSASTARSQMWLGLPNGCFQLGGSPWITVAAAWWWFSCGELQAIWLKSRKCLSVSRCERGRHPVVALDGLCFLVAYQLNSLFIFMMLFLFNVQLRNKYDDDDYALTSTFVKMSSLAHTKSYRGLSIALMCLSITWSVASAAPLSLIASRYWRRTHWSVVQVHSTDAVHL